MPCRTIIDCTDVSTNSHTMFESCICCRSDYLLSLTGEAALRLLGSPGKSGSVFFLSDDDRWDVFLFVRRFDMLVQSCWGR